MKLPEKITKTREGRDFALSLLILDSDSKDVEVIEEQLRLLKILESGEWKKYLPAPKTERQCVYFILNTAQRVVKIGYTANIEARFDNLQVGSVDYLKLLATVPGGRRLENQIHKRLSHLKVRSEWFKDCVELREIIKEAQAGGILKMEFSKELALSLLNSTEVFPVNFEDAWKWIGYSTKHKAKLKLTNNFEENTEYSTKRLKTPAGGRPSEYIGLTIECFKSLAMMAGTAKGKEVRSYFLECEHIAKEAAQTIPAQNSRIRELELQLAIATAQAEAAREQRYLIECNAAIATLHGMPALALIQGRPEVVVEKTEVVEKTVIADQNLRPLATFDGVGIESIVKRYHFGNGRKANDACRIWMKSVGFDESYWVQELTAHQTTKFPRELLKELDKAWAAKKGTRQRLIGE